MYNIPSSKYFSPHELMFSFDKFHLYMLIENNIILLSEMCLQIKHALHFEVALNNNIYFLINPINFFICYIQITVWIPYLNWPYPTRLRLTRPDPTWLDLTDRQLWPDLTLQLADQPKLKSRSKYFEEQLPKLWSSLL